MTTTETPVPSRRGLILPLVMMLAMMVVLGLIGGVCIDQGRSVATSVGDQADQAMRLRGALAVAERATLEAHDGKVDAVSKSLDEVSASLKAAAEHETYDRRRDRIHVALPLVDAFRTSVQTGDNVKIGAASEPLLAALSDLDHRQAKDLTEAEVIAPVAVMRTTSLYATLLLVVVGFSIVMAAIALRSQRR